MEVRHAPQAGRSDRCTFREASEQGSGRSDWPSERTIRDIRKAHLAASTEERLPYRYATWPEAMAMGALQWEVSAALLELLRSRVDELWPAWADLPAETILRPPTVREAHWFWRVTHAVPGAPVSRRRRASQELAAYEALGDIPSAILRNVEGFLMFRPWTPAGDAVYESAAAWLGIQHLRGLGGKMTIPPGVSMTQAAEAAAALGGLMPHQAADEWVRRAHAAAAAGEEPAKHEHGEERDAQARQ